MELICILNLTVHFIGANWLNMGLTIIDSLDTMLIMGLEDHFGRARDWVQKSLDFNRVITFIFSLFFT